MSPVFEIASIVILGVLLIVIVRLNRASRTAKRGAAGRICEMPVEGQYRDRINCFKAFNKYAPPGET